MSKLPRQMTKQELVHELAALKERMREDYFALKQGVYVTECPGVVAMGHERRRLFTVTTEHVIDNIVYTLVEVKTDDLAQALTLKKALKAAHPDATTEVTYRKGFDNDSSTVLRVGAKY